MDHRPSEALKPLAVELVDLIAGKKDGVGRKEELLRLFLPLKDKIPEKGIGDEPVYTDRRTVGIWAEVSNNGKVCYKRDPKKNEEWVAWANVDTLYPKSAKAAKRRVILMGESVARGYLYDPHYNVAKELEAILTATLENTKLEVIDLAKTSITRKELLEVAEESVLLDPDLIVFFAGNNWSFDVLALLNNNDYEDILDPFGRGDLAGVNAFVEQRIAGMVSEFLTSVKEIFKKRNIPVVFVIPEFNLRDWKSDDKEQALAWLPGDHAEKWVRAMEKAIQALTIGDVDQLGAAAEEMVALNPFNPLSHDLFARFHVLKGDYRRARVEFEHSRDVVLFSGTRTKPRCYSMIRDQLLLQSSLLGIEIVDLPAIFEQVYPDVPCREQFLDYCHLTVDGIKTAMRYTAQIIIRVLHGQHIDISDILASGLYPEVHVLAIAHLGAAIHNAHSGQPAEIIRHHCDKALQYSLKIRSVMEGVADFSTRRASSIFCRSFGDLILDGEMRQYEGARALLHPKGRKMMDVSLVDSITSSLNRAGINIREDVDKLRMEEHGVAQGNINLLESFYSCTNYNSYIDEQEVPYYQSRTFRSNFYFVTGFDEALQFTINFRLPGAGITSQYTEFCINDERSPFLRLSATGDWITHSFNLSSEELSAGVNRLTIRWPLTPRPLNKSIPVSRYTVLKTMFPVLGEISSFIVQRKERKK